MPFNASSFSIRPARRVPVLLSIPPQNSPERFTRKSRKGAKSSRVRFFARWTCQVVRQETPRPTDIRGRCNVKQQRARKSIKRKSKASRRTPRSNFQISILHCAKPTATSVRTSRHPLARIQGSALRFLPPLPRRPLFRRDYESFSAGP